MHIQDGNTSCYITISVVLQIMRIRSFRIQIKKDPWLHSALRGRAGEIDMVRERSIDLVILFLNVVAIVILVGVLSVIVNTSDAQEASNEVTALTDSPMMVAGTSNLTA